MTHWLTALTLGAAAGVAMAAPALPSAAATAACERTTLETLRETRGAAAAASFTGPASLVPGAADASDITLRGAGQVRTPSGARPFSYSCTYDTRADAVTGVVVREASARESAPAVRDIEPDLSQISPTACESAAAGALKRRWPSVGHISFNADTRQLSQIAGGSATLRGQGTATPSVRAPATHFGYDCTVDPRNGRVTGVRIAD